MRVGINGMGRVGRAYLRRASQCSNVDVVAVNDITDAETLAHLLRHDSTFGPFPGGDRAGRRRLVIDGRKIAGHLASATPDELPWERTASTSSSSAPASSAPARRPPGT